MHDAEYQSRRKCGCHAGQADIKATLILKLRLTLLLMNGVESCVLTSSSRFTRSKSLMKTSWNWDYWNWDYWLKFQLLSRIKREIRTIENPVVKTRHRREFVVGNDRSRSRTRRYARSTERLVYQNHDLKALRPVLKTRAKRIVDKMARQRGTRQTFVVCELFET